MIYLFGSASPVSGTPIIQIFGYEKGATVEQGQHSCLLPLRLVVQTPDPLLESW